MGNSIKTKKELLYQSSEGGFGKQSPIQENLFGLFVSELCEYC